MPSSSASSSPRSGARGGPSVRQRSAALEWRTEGPPRLPLRGDELAEELGIEPGPDLGQLIHELEEASYAGEVTNADQAVEYARKLREN